MNNIGKIAGINLLIMLAYMAINWSANMGTPEGGLSYMVMAMLLVGAHALIMFIVSLVYFSRKENEIGKAWLLSALIVIVVGFSACFGGASL